MNKDIRKFKNITDYIYGLISIPNHFFKFIDSIYIQRLRNIRQLPTAQYVFPSVNHTCFEHSLGTYYLSNKYITDLKSRQSELDINQTLINTISLCGLFNNLGTLPFLISFKSFFKEKYNYDFNEKEKSYDLILKLFESKGIDPECITNKNDDENCNLDIIKKIFTTKNNNLKFYEQIVFNHKTGIDCESFDNLNRDIYKYGSPPLYDYNILMNSTQVINDEICYRYKDGFSVYDYYNAKYTIATKFYYHRISTAIELMFTDIIKLIDPLYNFNDLIKNNDKFIYCFDSFLYNIKLKENKQLEDAKIILENIDKRNLYTFIGEYYLSNKQSDSEFNNFDANTLLENRNKTDVKIDQDEIRIKKDVLYLGPGDFDPLNNIYFYDNEYNIIKRKNEDVSKLLAKRFKSRIIKVFLINKDKKKILAAQNALENYKQKYKGYTHIYKSEQKIKNDEGNINNYNLNIGLDIDEERELKELNKRDNNKNNNSKNKNNKIKEKEKEKDFSEYLKQIKKEKEKEKEKKK